MDLITLAQMIGHYLIPKQYDDDMIFFLFLVKMVLQKSRFFEDDAF